MPTSNTPFYSAWLKTAVRALEPHGRKADLARYLTTKYGRDQRSWERHIAAIVAGDREPKADLYLAIKNWIDGL